MVCAGLVSASPGPLLEDIVSAVSSLGDLGRSLAPALLQAGATAVTGGGAAAGGAGAAGSVINYARYLIDLYHIY